MSNLFKFKLGQNSKFLNIAEDASGEDFVSAVANNQISDEFVIYPALLSPSVNALSPVIGSPTVNPIQAPSSHIFQAPSSLISVSNKSPTEYHLHHHLQQDLSGGHNQHHNHIRKQSQKPNHFLLYTIFGCLLVASVGIESVRCQGSSVGGGGGSGAGGPYATNGAGVGEILAPRLNSNEPTCEQLREMWHYSKRQSRAAEVTNEIPTYRDPFAYNVWDPFYPTQRSIGGIRVNPRYREMTVARPVFGRILHKEPMIRLPDRSRTYGDISKYYGNEQKGFEGSRGAGRRNSNFRFSGTPVSQNALTPQKGSFQRLKELVWTERARELAQQRKAEESAARAAVLKEIANGNAYNSRRQNQQDDMMQQQQLQQQHHQQQQQQHLQQQQQLLREGYESDILPRSSSSVTSSKTFVDERSLNNDSNLPSQQQRYYQSPNNAGGELRKTSGWSQSAAGNTGGRRASVRNHSKLRSGFADNTFYGDTNGDLTANKRQAAAADAPQFLVANNGFLSSTEEN